MQQSSSWSLVCHLDYGDHGRLSVIRHDGKSALVTRLERGAASPQDAAHKPVFLGVAPDDSVLLMDAESREITKQGSFPEDAFVPYAYRDTDSRRIWFMNDGDEDTGCDALNCGDTGSSVMVVNTETVQLHKTICVGRGHHVTVFTRPTEKTPNIPQRAFVSNLQDGTISVIGNNEKDAATYLKVISTINLCQPDKEEGGTLSVPNNAFPHGMEFSPVTGKVYNLNNGYGTISIIDPVAASVEAVIPLKKKSSNLLLSPCGRFLIGKGADRKTDPDHVTGTLSVIDLQKRAVVQTLDLTDVYPSVYRFSPDGGKLYITTAATGKGAQHANLKKDRVLVFDANALPALKLTNEIKVGNADCGRRPLAFTKLNGARPFVFLPNPTDGTVSIVDAKNNTVVETVGIGEPNIDELLFSFWQDGIYGA